MSRDYVESTAAKTGIPHDKLPVLKLFTSPKHIMITFIIIIITKENNHRQK
jgi:hypothetical protein